MSLWLILCWALTFIIRLRFPPGESLADVLKKILRYEKKKRQKLLVKCYTYPFSVSFLPSDLLLGCVLGRLELNVSSRAHAKSKKFKFL